MTGSYLAIFLCVGACEQRVEDDDCLVQIPHKHPLENTRSETMKDGNVKLFSPYVRLCSTGQ